MGKNRKRCDKLYLCDMNSEVQEGSTWQQLLPYITNITKYGYKIMRLRQQVTRDNHSGYLMVTKYG